jgi:hypothetical protein
VKTPKGKFKHKKTPKMGVQLRGEYLEKVYGGKHVWQTCNLKTPFYIETDINYLIMSKKKHLSLL